MPLTLPPFDRRLVDADGFITPEWEPWFTRVDVRLIAKAWAVIIVSAGVPSIADSVGVASIADTGTGLLTVTLETPMASANWVALYSAESGAAASGGARFLWSVAGSKDASNIELALASGTPTLVDPTSWSFLAFGN